MALIRPGSGRLVQVDIRIPSGALGKHHRSATKGLQNTHKIEVWKGFGMNALEKPSTEGGKTPARPEQVARCRRTSRGWSRVEARSVRGEPQPLGPSLAEPLVESLEQPRL